MAELYSIQAETLTDIGDALRRRHGETEVITVIEQKPIPVSKVIKSPNAVSHDELGILTGNLSEYYVAQIEEATSLKVVVTAEMPSRGSQSVQIAAGAYYNTNNFPWNDIKVYLDDPVYKQSYVIENTNVITIYTYIPYSSGESRGLYVDVIGLDENGNEISSGSTIDVEVEKEVKKTYKSSEMAQAIDDIHTTVVEPIEITANGEYTAAEGVDGYAPITVNVAPELPEEAYTITGSCMYKFSGGGWDWFIRDYGDKVTTSDINTASYMFSDSMVEKIPFTLNFSYNSSGTSFQNAFKGCSNLKEAPVIQNLCPEGTSNMFRECKHLRYIPENYAENFYWSKIDNNTSAYSGDRSNMFYGCYSLRSVPMNFLNHGNPVAYSSYTIFNSGFNGCYVLDELVGLPIPHTAVYTSNIFSTAFTYCHRLKNIIFATPEGQPYVMKWKAQTIDLSSQIGYYDTANPLRFINYNSGITADKEVKDDATYQALKDDPDWFTTLAAYSRYNHDSAVATINSLPDTSAYLVGAGGTNTIKFTGNAGSATDGGAINTLTEAEIAVATAKGWTVSLV